MYLARKSIKGRTHYVIRESFRDDAVLRSRDLHDLGPDPGRHIVYPGGNAYYIDEAISDRLNAMGVDVATDELADIFWPFVRADIRHALDHFKNRMHKPRAPESAGPGEDFHIFDRRRVHFLRFGQMDQGRIGRVSPRLFQVLSGKSRDEIEQYMIQAERILKPREIKSYVFVIFDLQHHFTEHFARSMPQALDQRAVDAVFLAEICRLNEDPVFWSGLDRRHPALHDYLIRYLFFFFDHEYGQSSYLDDLIDNWMNRHREYRPPQRKTVSVQEASTIFGMTEARLKQLSRRELAWLFRKKAQELHPDKGGDHDAFIRLVEAYQQMKGKKK